MTHFSKRTLRDLARKGIRIVGLRLIPDMASAMPYANGATGYAVDDNGTGRVLTFGEVLAQVSA